MVNAIKSVLRQTFSDFEVIVVDNDDGDATRQAVSRFQDPRFHHCRTGNLSMPANWEHGCNQATGEYLLLLEDKQALRGDALAFLHRLIVKHQPPCIKWQADTLDDTTGATWVEEAGGSGEARFLASEEALRIFLGETASEGWRYLPVGHLSAFSRKLRESILAGPAGALCLPVCPDYTIGVQALAFGEGVLWVDAALVAMSRRHSNGRSVTQKTALGRQFMEELGGPSRLWSRTPIQAPIIPALIYNDYMELQALIGGRLRDFPMDWVNYYVESWCSVIGLDNDGVDVMAELAAFHSALASEPPDRQKQVWETIERRAGKPAKSLRKNRLKRFRRSTGLLALEQRWKNLGRRLTGRRHFERFKNPLEFVVWADAQIPTITSK